VDEKSVEREMTLKEYEGLERTDGGNVVMDKMIWYRDFAQEQHGGQLATCWPMLSDAAGVHPDQIGEAKTKAAAAGIRVDFHPDGRVRFESAKQRKQYCEFRGLYDRNGGYGDPQKRS
jgi:hypothetical protein